MTKSLNKKVGKRCSCAQRMHITHNQCHSLTVATHHFAPNYSHIQHLTVPIGLSLLSAVARRAPRFTHAHNANFTY